MAALPDSSVSPPASLHAQKSTRVPAAPISTDRETRRQTHKRQASSRSRYEGEEGKNSPATENKTRAPRAAAAADDDDAEAGKCRERWLA